jgi:hypothetical protein
MSTNGCFAYGGYLLHSLWGMPVARGALGRAPLAQVRAYLAAGGAGSEQRTPGHHFLSSGGRATFPCKPHPNEELRRENEKAATRALQVGP